MDTNKPQGYTVRRAAEVLGVTVQTVYRWLDDGVLTKVPGIEGDIAILEAEPVQKLKAERELVSEPAEVGK